MLVELTETEANVLGACAYIVAHAKAHQVANKEEFGDMNAMLDVVKEAYPAPHPGLCSLAERLLWIDEIGQQLEAYETELGDVGEEGE